MIKTKSFRDCLHERSECLVVLPSEDLRLERLVNFSFPGGQTDRGEMDEGGGGDHCYLGMDD